MGKKNWAKHDAERDRLFQLVPEQLPDDLFDWTVNDVLNELQYVYYNRKSRYAYCTRCQTVIDQRYLMTNGAAHNRETTCPHCNGKAVYKCIGRYRKQPLDQIRCFIRFMQRTPEGIVVRRFEVIRKIEHNNHFEETYVLWYWSEVQRVFNNGIKCVRYRGQTQYDGKVHWFESRFESFAMKSFMGNWRWEIEADYRRNLLEVVEGTWLQYAGLSRSLGEFGAWTRPIEQLMKGGMGYLAKDMLGHQTAGLNLNAKTVHEFLRVPKECVAMVRKLDPDIHELAAIKRMIKFGIKNMTRDDVEFTNRYWEIYKAATKITEIDFQTYMNHFRKHRVVGNNGNASLYIDYLRMCKEMGYDLTDRSVLFPKDVSEAHDREAVRLKVKKNEKVSIAIQQRYQVDKKRFATESGGFIIRPPQDMNELLSEGSKLQHCVGTYAERVAKKETTILLIRRAETPEDPYFTVEWRDGRLIQCRGKRNCEPPEEVKQFVETWQKVKRLNKPKQASRRVQA
jgi:hypothetical protein